MYGDEVAHDVYDSDRIQSPNLNAIAQSGNLYVYALNAPTQYTDPTGFLAYPGQIHNIVVNRLHDLYGFETEQTIYYAIGWGRADLISKTGKIWDVKRDKPEQIARGIVQVKTYADNIWKGNADIELGIGGYIPPEELIYTINVDTYYITYRYAGGGVIAYDYYKETDPEKVKAYVEAASALALSGALMFFSGGTIQAQPAY